MKKIVKTIAKPVVKPLLTRFNELNDKVTINENKITLNEERLNDLNNKITENQHNILMGEDKINHLKNKICEAEDKINNLNNSVDKLKVTYDDLNYRWYESKVALENKNKELETILDLQVKNNELLTAKLNAIENQFFSHVDNIFYYHGGSGNHGCEALVRTLCEINNFVSSQTLLYSYQEQEDYEFGINNICNNIIHSNLDANELSNYYKNTAIALSIGGDNYCGYPYVTDKLCVYNEKFNKRGVKTALIGSSIEPEVLAHQEVLDDLEEFSLITARESLTYEALKNAGITKNLHLVPDSAFTLKDIELKLPENFILGKTIGLNVSNLVQAYDSKVYNNYKNLIKYIIENTDYNIALIPHVIQSFNDDMELLNMLYREFIDTKRICLIKNCNCMELKGYIKRCCMFIGARTHATISAYSSCVPTLVLGYSIKSKGIAKDLFGTYDNYVLSVQDLQNDDDLIKSFIWLDKNKKSIKSHLEEIMPNYIKSCYEIKELIDDLKSKNKELKLPNIDYCAGCEVCASV